MFFSLQYNSMCRLRLQASFITIEEIKAVHKIGSILCSMQIHTSRPIKKLRFVTGVLWHITCNVSLDAEAGSRAGIMNRSMGEATIEIGEECSSPIFSIGEEFLTNLGHWWGSSPMFHGSILDQWFSGADNSWNGCWDSATFNAFSFSLAIIVSFAFEGKAVGESGYASDGRIVRASRFFFENAKTYQHHLHCA